MALNKPSQYILAATACGFFLMLGSRFETLRFGQVFPERRAEDEAKIKDLEAKITALETDRKQMREELETRVEEVEAEASLLRSTVTELEDRAPVVIQREVPARSTATPTPKSAAKPAAIAAENSVVHRGDGAEKVRRVFGKPDSVNVVYGTYEVWYYDGSSKSISFEGGRVTEWDGMPIEP